jgi:hypothetical protein
MLHVSSRERGVKLFRGGSDRKVRHAYPGVTATPRAAKLPCPPRNPVVHQNPADQRKQPVCCRALTGAQTLKDLDTADLGTHGSIVEAAQVTVSLD